MTLNFKGNIFSLVRVFSLTACILHLIILNVFSQNTLEFHAPENGNVSHTACKSIEYNAGYYYLALAGTAMNAQIDPFMVCDVQYISEEYTPGNTGNFNSSLTVGTTAGALDVSPYGTATYNVPLYIPPGTFNMSPSLNLVYNSTTQNGLLGIGWALSGSILSSISRTGHNSYFDGYIGGVNITNSDRYALDGSRLFAFTGNNGENGTTYKTEIENYSTITSHGQEASGPEYFTVLTKEGLTLEYGNTDDSYIEAHNASGAMTWLLDKVTDSNGNFIKIYYNENNTEAEFRTDRIEYTGNDAAGINPYNQIKFIYSTRNDKQLVLQSGYAIKQTVLLSGIKMFVEGQLARSYEINYTYDNRVGSHLSEIFEISATGQRYNPLKFGWSVSENSSAADPNTNSGEVSLGVFPVGSFPFEEYAGDFNGDGFTDYFIVDATLGQTPRAWRLYFNNAGNGFNTNYISGDMPGGYERMVTQDSDIPGNLPPGTRGNFPIVDVNGDGKDDIIVKGKVWDSSWNAYRVFFTALVYNGSTLTELTAIKPTEGVINGTLTGLNNHISLGDYDGDGSTDLFLFYHKEDKWYVHNFKTPNTYSGENEFGDETSVFTAIEFNGDGKTELLLTHDASHWVLSLDQINNSMYTISSGGFPNSCEKMFPGDFNGDGITDLLMYNECSQGWMMSYAARDNNGIIIYHNTPAINPPFNTPDPNGNQLAQYDCLVSDFNGDNKSDIALFYHYFGGSNDIKYIEMYYSAGFNTFTHETIQLNTTYQSQTGNIYLGDFNGDSHTDIMHGVMGSHEHRGIYFLSSSVSGFSNVISDYNKITSITNGLNETINLDYSTLPALNAVGNYQIGQTNDNNIIDFQKAASVAYKIIRTDGIGGVSNTIYSYNGAKLHNTGKGFLGFSKITSENNISLIKIETSYDLNTDYYIPFPKETKVSYAGNPLSKTESSYNFIPVSGIKFRMELSGQTVTDDVTGANTEVSNIIYQGGNISHQETSINNGLESTVVDNTYISVGPLNVQKIFRSEITKTRLNEDPVSTSAFFVYNNLGQLTTEYKNDGTAREISSSYDYYLTGNIQTHGIYTSNAASRINVYEYDENFRFVTREHNTLNQVSETIYDARWGVPLSTTGIDGLTTRFEYDGFGNGIKTITPDNLTSTTRLEWVQQGSAPGDNYLGSNSKVVFSSISSSTGGPEVNSFYDILGREIISETEGFDSKIYNEKSYYPNGNLKSETGTYKSGASSHLTTNYFYVNAAGGNNPQARPGDMDHETITDGNGNNNTTSYNYNFSVTNGKTTVTVTDPAGNQTSKTIDAAGRVTIATDNGGDIEYSYNSNGLTTEISVNGVVSASMTYDDFGFQETLTDKDAGTITYSYDNFGQLLSQTDARGNTNSIVYDDLGRVEQKSGLDGTYNYSYVPSGNGINQLQSITASNGSSSFVYAYDGLQRQTSVTQTVNSVAFATSYEYDNLSRLLSTTYENGFSTTNIYNNVGLLTEIKNGNTAIWHANEINQSGQINKYTLGNGIQTNITYNSFGFPNAINAGNVQNLQMDFDIHSGNLNSRTDALKSLSETFTPDNLNRLTDVTGPEPLSISYKPDGTIESKSYAGTYSLYSTAHPDAVEEITNISASAISHSTQELTYNGNNKVSTIKENNNELKFFYGHNQQRVKTQLKDISSGATISTKYFNGDFERLIIDGHVYEIIYIHSPTGLCAMHITTDGANGKLYYVYTDHLGSILTLTDEQGDVKYEQSFDAWGRNRNPHDWHYTSYSNHAPPVWLYRGYTGHEHLTEFALINMNGRCYDPVVGMMISVDNYVSDPTCTKSFNRYSYALGNPLTYFDPDGDLPILVFVVAAAIGGGMNIWSNWDNIAKDPWSAVGYFASGAVGGAVSVVNPVLGGSITAGGNITTDLAFGNVPDFNDPGDVLKYAGGKALDGLGAAGAGQLSKSGYNLLTKMGWVQNLSKVGTAHLANEATGLAGGVIGPEFTLTATQSVLTPGGKVAANIGKNLAKTYSEATFNALKNQAQQYGTNSLFKTQASIQRNLAEHVQKLEGIKKLGGYTSSIEREMRTFQSQLDAIQDLLKIIK